MRFLWTFALWLCLWTLPFATVAAVDVSYGPSTHATAERCTRACHDRGCVHLGQKVDLERPAARAAEALYLANIRALRGPSMGYRDTNLAVYLLGFPAIGGVLLWGALWRRPTRGSWAVLALVAGALGGVVSVVAARPMGLLAWGSGRDAVYWACTDFCVHMGNLTGLTYEGFNFLLFVVGFPVTLVGLAAWGVARGVRMARRRP
jgi:hypothetical protein